MTTTPFEVCLAFNEIEHRATRVSCPETNGFVERFHCTSLDEFVRPAFRQSFYESGEARQADLDEWFVHYNTERPHLGYRNQGRISWQTVKQFLGP